MSSETAEPSPLSINNYIAPALIGRCKVVKLVGHKKRTLETKWQDIRNYSPHDPEVIEHISTGQNYGIIPINNTITIDCDTLEIYDNLPDRWKESLTLITGREKNPGHHVYLDCKNSPQDKITLLDKSNPKIQHGDIRGSNSNFFTVGAGSIHPDTGRKYIYKNPNAEIVSVTWEEIETELISRYTPTLTEIPEPSKTKRKSNTGSLTDKLGLRIEDFAMPDDATKRPNGEFQGSHPIHGSETGMNFAINPKKNVWHCFRCKTGGDPVSWIAYAHCNVSETDCNNLSNEQFKEVINWLKHHGYSKEIKKLGDEYFAEDPNLPHVDISGLLSEKEEPINMDKEIKEAKDRCLLPPFPELEPGVFKDYLDFGNIVSYSLIEFHFASLLTIASMAIGRKVVIKVGMTSIYPNVFAMVVGQTTISGKSVACNMAVDNFGSSIVYEEPLAKFNSTNIIRGTISEAALIQGLNDVYNSLWYWDDAAGFFEDATTWNAHILGTMCSIYDGGVVERTLSKRSKRGEQYKWSCPFPFMSLLFNTTTKDIEQIASSRLFSSGFFPRMMWFYGQGGQPRKNEDVADEDKEILGAIQTQIKDLRETLSPMKMDSIIFGVCDIIEDWKIDVTADRLGKEDEAFRTAISRGFIHAYKIAAILAMMDKSFQKQIFGSVSFPVITKIPDKHALMAIKIVEQYLIPRMMLVYEMCNNIDAKNHQVIVIKALNHFGGVVERSKLLRQTRLGKRELDAALSTLIESGEIKCYSETKKGAKKSTMTVIKQ
jgi:hypothetical protein